MRKLINQFNTDYSLALICAIVTGLVTTAIFVLNGYTSLYQACGRGMLRVPFQIEQLNQFILGKTSHFDCNLLPNEGYTPIGLFASLQIYLTWSSAFLWRLFGLHQLSLLPLVLGLSAFYGAGCYLLLRQFLDCVRSVIGALIIGCSPLALQMIIGLRDYSKAPFFIWAILLTLLVINTTSYRRKNFYAILAGAVVGIGYGFRGDVIILIPVCAITMLLASIFEVKGVIKKIIPSIIFVISALAIASPLLASYNFVTSGGSVVMQGASEPFRKQLALQPAGYALAWAYSDELTLSEIASEKRQKYLNWDDNEVSHLPGYDLSNVFAYSSEYLFTWTPIFAADFAAQGLKSAAWILGMPAYLVNSSSQYVRLSPIKFVYDLIGVWWLPFFGLIGAIILYWRSLIISLTRAPAIAFLFISLAGYTGVQMSPRHIFHLEFIWLLSLLSVTMMMTDIWRFKRWPKYQKSIKVLLISILSLVLFIFTSYNILVWWQSKNISLEMQNLLASDRQLVDTISEQNPNGSIRIKVPIPERYLALTKAPKDSMTPSIATIGLQWDVRAASDRLLATFSGPNCVHINWNLNIVYKHGEAIWQPMDSVLHISPMDNDTNRFQVMFPVFYRPTQHFTELLLPASHSNCIVKLERLIVDSRLPKIMSAQLDSTGLPFPLHKGLGGFHKNEQKHGLMERQVLKQK